MAAADAAAGGEDGSARQGDGGRDQDPVRHLKAIDASLRRSATALREIRAVTTRTAALTELEQRLSRASAPLGQLFDAVESADAAPTPVVRDA